jgi:hypothetical protein
VSWVAYKNTKSAAEPNVGALAGIKGPDFIVFQQWQSLQIEDSHLTHLLSTD